MGWSVREWERSFEDILFKRWAIQGVSRDSSRASHAERVGGWEGSWNGVKESVVFSKNGKKSGSLIMRVKGLVLILLSDRHY